MRKVRYYMYLREISQVIRSQGCTTHEFSLGEQKTAQSLSDRSSRQSSRHAGRPAPRSSSGTRRQTTSWRMSLCGLPTFPVRRLIDLDREMLIRSSAALPSRHHPTGVKQGSAILLRNKHPGDAVVEAGSERWCGNSLGPWRGRLADCASPPGTQESPRRST